MAFRAVKTDLQVSQISKTTEGVFSDGVNLVAFNESVKKKKVYNSVARQNGLKLK